MHQTILLSFALSALVSLAAWRLRALSRSGALAAFILGGLIFASGGLSWAALLLTFFISSSLLSRLFRTRKASLDEKYSKSSQRDAAQVLANGGLGIPLALALWLLPGAEWTFVAFGGAIAAANADTWATELGVLSRKPPRLLTSGQFVERGTSGGVTLLGLAASLSGAALVGLAGSCCLPPGGRLAFFFAAALGGLSGSLVDSLLGATRQAIFYCPTCAKETERHPHHTCGSPTTYRRGWRWLDNDWVNFFCTLTGALTAAVVWRIA